MRSAQHSQEARRGPKYERSILLSDTIFMRVCANTWETCAPVMRAGDKCLIHI